MNVWRIQSSTSKGNISKYCIENHLAAMGWSLLKYDGNASDLDFNNFEEYCEMADCLYGSDSNYYNNVYKFVYELQVNDLIWIRSEGIYYCARITEESEWYFDNSDTARKKDACNTRTNLKWVKIGDESDVPGALTTAFIRGKALQKINKEGIRKYSQIIYDQKADDNFKYNIDMTLNQENFYSLISPSDCEDLLYFWLNSKNSKYVCIPSTNKISTPKYEFVILDVETGKHIYIQVKNGSVDIDADKYYPLIEGTQNEVYLLTTDGSVKNADKYNEIHVVDPSDLFEFACDEKNQNYIPPNVDFWLQFAGGISNNTNDNKPKGIMIDTNDEECEKYMLENHVIAAWGTPKKYIESFKKNDIALFYKKCYGIVAIGKVLSDSVNVIENGYEAPVEWLVEKSDSKDGIISVYPYEIKKLLGKNFYFASTRKVPFLTERECDIIINELKLKQL